MTLVGTKVLQAFYTVSTMENQEHENREQLVEESQLEPGRVDAALKWSSLECSRMVIARAHFVGIKMPTVCGKFAIFWVWDRGKSLEWQGAHGKGENWKIVVPQRKYRVPKSVRSLGSMKTSEFPAEP